MDSELARIVASNVRAEAARRGCTQTKVAELVELAQPAVSDRYRERRQWQLEDLDKLGRAWGLDPAELLARPKGFEPLTF
ncbi:MAG: helix-turn-helix domain-containing protein [Micrococcales bacterium]|nr:helix-turn-helix domain-containing protein [Micrococcales bacterium]